jgi:hypothetical protein
MRTTALWIKAIMACAAIAALAAAAQPSQAAEPEKPVAGKQVRFEKGFWSAVPQVRDGKVSQCVLVARRSRAGSRGDVATNLSFAIGRGAGFAIGLRDDGISPEHVLDDQAEIILDEGSAFPAAGFDVASAAFAMHPGDAAAVLAGLDKAVTLRLRSDGAGLDTGAIKLDLPGEALDWLKQCGKIFDIAIDRPSAPDAPDLPAPRPRSAKIAPAQPTAAGPPGIEDKQKISGWDASELRARDGAVVVCLIRRHYVTGSEKDARQIGTFLMVSRAKGLTMMLKDSSLNLPAGKPIEATLTAGSRPFSGFSAAAISKDEIGLYPQHGAALALALEDGGRFDFKSKIVGLEFPVQSGVVAWLRACSRRHGFGIEPASP